jgi:hypothetical protein
MGARDNEELHEVTTEKRSSVGDHETIDLVAVIDVDETLVRRDRALENLVRSLCAQPRDPTLSSEGFETVKGSGEADDASVWHEKA